jgi:hypothetical protein
MINCEYIRILEKMFVVCFKRLSWHLPGRTEESNNNPVRIDLNAVGI